MARLVSEKLADLVTQFNYNDIPVEIIERVKGSILDQLGCQLAASTFEWNKIPYRFIRDLDGRPECSIVNYGTKALLYDAAYVNGVFGEGAELDDLFQQGGAHPGALSVPAAMAIAEKDHLDGKSFVTAVLVGYESLYRINAMLMPSISARGWHPHSVLGVFSVAAIAGKLWHLTWEEMVQAFAIAGSHASGTQEYDQSGGEVKRLHTGIALRGGLQSAMLAKYGLTGPRSIFEGNRGICLLFAGQHSSEKFSEFGQEWGILQTGIKRFSCVGANHNPIDILSKIIQENDLEASQIEKIEVYTNPLFLRHGGTIIEPHDVISAQFSLGFCLALRLLKGSNDIDLYQDPHLWHDAEIMALAHRIMVKAEPKVTEDRKFAASLIVRLKNGKVIEGSSECAKGFAGNPLTKKELQDKFRGLAVRALPKAQVESIIETVDRLEQLSDVNELVTLLIRRY